MDIHRWWLMKPITLLMLGVIVLLVFSIGVVEKTIAEDVKGSNQGEKSTVELNGIVNSIDPEGSIVISDMTFFHTGATKFYNKSGYRIKLSGLKINDYVQVFSTDGNLEELHLVSKEDLEKNQAVALPHSPQNQGAPETSRTDNGKKETIRLDGGVWKN